MSRSGALIEKSQRFGSRMVKLNRYLRECCREWMISNQIFRSGTSIGANIAEGVFAISEKDLRAKHRIALKEARETSYWLFLLKDGGYISEREYESLEGDLEELIRMLLASVRTLERRDQTP